MAALADGLESAEPIARLLARVPEPARDAARAPVREYLFCHAATDAQACARLDRDDPVWCREAVAQVRARAEGRTPWFGVPEALSVCAARLPAEECARYAVAVEKGDPAACTGLREELADCAAVAGGDPSRCAAAGPHAASCRRTVTDVRALRAGVAALLALEDGPYRAVALGHTKGSAACRDELRRRLF